MLTLLRESGLGPLRAIDPVGTDSLLRFLSANQSKPMIKREEVVYHSSSQRYNKELQLHQVNKHQLVW